ncbi:MAG: hypothetical protein SFV17_26115 [Candidatus Obscuribacter sp.]|nr:hypothetical protein [Candidatus Obscuribacter sp.]
MDDLSWTKLTRRSVHQDILGGIVSRNPDKATNSIFLCKQLTHDNNFLRSMDGTPAVIESLRQQVALPNYVVRWQVTTSQASFREDAISKIVRPYTRSWNLQLCQLLSLKWLLLKYSVGRDND